MSRPLTAALLLALLLGASPLAAGVVEVRIKLPVRAKIDLAGRRTVAIAPFITVGREGAGRQSESSVDVQQEFERHLTKLLRRETDLKLVESGRVDYPTYELDLLSRNRDFWRALGERLQTDLILTGSLDFDVQDKSGYRTEEYVSPYDGRTYYRQVLVEQTGFEYDIVFQVYDGRTGELLFHDNFKDFKQIEGEKADPLLGMFENLRALEDRIAGVFTQKQVEASRLLLTD
ncbi:MAG: hypothetical protein GX178_11595 [Acidobacteria bacterium]|jgi:hypothetical protein|nr:hypothetical protein [Thermoanaerobaculia bacterium]MDI9631742.1 hypothetical protein [Acidobacteriota bacterium]OQC42432.1 MAG: hypothetical protein BWX64_00153 [Acidobacteria bacterium ADurb.Bin051]MBP7813223.1 hypothetical protein [Thermoanaerobaculia bacterium]MBP8845018.1 hypothetical protein [Thermoanaerobaculia bacterium]